MKTTRVSATSRLDERQRFSLVVRSSRRLHGYSLPRTLGTSNTVFLELAMPFWHPGESGMKSDNRKLCQTPFGKLLY